VFGRLHSQGTFYTAGMQLSNGAVVLPLICAHQGLTWVAALISCDAVIPWNGAPTAVVFLLTCAAVGVLLGISGVA
jgi:hypothetical protein